MQHEEREIKAELARLTRSGDLEAYSSPEAQRSADELGDMLAEVIELDDKQAAALWDLAATADHTEEALEDEVPRIVQGAPAPPGERVL